MYKPSTSAAPHRHPPPSQAPGGKPRRRLQSTRRSRRDPLATGPDR